MRPTKVTSKARDLYPVIQPHVPDMTPLTLAVDDPQASYPPTDHPAESCQPIVGKRRWYLRTVLDLDSHLISTNRPRREIKPPIRFKDNVIK